MIDRELEALKERFMNGEPIYDKFVELIRKLHKTQLKLEQYLWYFQSIASDERYKLRKLYIQLAHSNLDYKFDRIKRIAKQLSSDSSLRDDFEKQAYRIMELARYGKRSEVQSMFLRIFISNRRKFDDVLMDVFNPIYPDEIFKTFIYTFLAGLTGGGDES